METTISPWELRLPQLGHRYCSGRFIFDNLNAVLYMKPAQTDIAADEPHIVQIDIDVP